MAIYMLAYVRFWWLKLRLFYIQVYILYLIIENKQTDLLAIHDIFYSRNNITEHAIECILLLDSLIEVYHFQEQLLRHLRTINFVSIAIFIIVDAHTRVRDRYVCFL